MKTEGIRTIARQHSIRSNRPSKSDLVRTIQAEEGNVGCFATAVGGECDQLHCLWREDCFDAALHQGEPSSTRSSKSHSGNGKILKAG